MSLAAPIPTLKHAQTYLAMHHPAALRSLARELKVSDSLRRQAADYNEVSFHHANEPSEFDKARGKVDIWAFASTIVVYVQDALPDAEEVVLDHHGFVFLSYSYDIAAHVVADLLVAIYLDHHA